MKDNGVDRNREFGNYLDHVQSNLEVCLPKVQGNKEDSVKKQVLHMFPTFLC